MKGHKPKPNPDNVAIILVGKTGVLEEIHLLILDGNGVTITGSREDFGSAYLIKKATGWSCQECVFAYTGFRNFPLLNTAYFATVDHGIVKWVTAAHCTWSCQKHQ